MKNHEHETRMMTARTNADLLEKYWDSLPEEERKKMVFDMCFAVRELMLFRNIINRMVDLKNPVESSIKSYFE